MLDPFRIPSFFKHALQEGVKMLIFASKLSKPPTQQLREYSILPICISRAFILIRSSREIVATPSSRNGASPENDGRLDTLFLFLTKSGIASGVDGLFDFPFES
jgi:hypothetical protein